VDRLGGEIKWVERWVLKPNHVTSPFFFHVVRAVCEQKWFFFSAPFAGGYISYMNGDGPRRNLNPKFRIDKDSQE
jgi:hypothetical protein